MSAIQSPVGAQRQLRGAGPAQRRRDLARCSAAASANADRSAGGGRDLLVRPVSGSTRVTRPTAGSSSRAGRAPRRRAGRAGRTGRAAAVPSPTGAEEVGDDDGQPAAPRRAAELLEGSGQVPAVARRRPAGSSASARSRCCRCAGRRGPGTRASSAPVATTAPIRLPPPRVRCPTAAARGDHQVPLLAAGGAEVQRRRTGRRPARSPVPGRRPSAGCAARWSGRSPTSPSGGRRRPGSTAARPRVRCPGPGTRPRWLPCSRPSSRRRTVSSSVLSAASSRAGSAVDGGRPARAGGVNPAASMAGAVSLAAGPPGPPTGSRHDASGSSGLGARG